MKRILSNYLKLHNFERMKTMHLMTWIGFSISFKDIMISSKDCRISEIYERPTLKLLPYKSLYRPIILLIVTFLHLLSIPSTSKAYFVTVVYFDDTLALLSTVVHSCHISVNFPIIWFRIDCRLLCKLTLYLNKLNTGNVPLVISSRMLHFMK